MATTVIDSDVYYKGVAGERIQELADGLLHIAQEAEREQHTTLPCTWPTR